MIMWLDAQLSPALAKWVEETLGFATVAVRDLGLRSATDFSIFQAARKAVAIVLTKDIDFTHLLAKHGPPPKVIWLTCGNTSNHNLRRILGTALAPVLRLLESGESIVEITGSSRMDCT